MKNKIKEEKRIYDLEKEIIKKYPEFSSLKPKPIKIMKTFRYSGKASNKYLRISEDFLKNCDKESLNRLLIHEINHYLFKEEGHSKRFIDNVIKTYGEIDEYILIRNIVELNPEKIEGRCYFNAELNDKNELTRIEIKFVERPDWNNFVNLMDSFNKNSGIFFKRLRENKRLSIERVSKDLLINKNILRKIESKQKFSSKDPSYGYTFLQKLFWYYVNNGSQEILDKYLVINQKKDEK